MVEFHSPHAFNPSDQTSFKYSEYFRRLEPGVTFEQIFQPAFWLHVKGKLRQDDVIRLQAYDRSFDVLVTVRAVVAGGVIMRFLSGDPGPNIEDPFRAVAEIRNKNLEPQIAPLNAQGESLVRFEFIPTTKWRVLGLNGAEVKRNIETREEAELHLSAYLKEINMRLPTEEESKAHASSVVAKT